MITDSKYPAAVVLRLRLPQVQMVKETSSSSTTQRQQNFVAASRAAAPRRRAITTTILSESELNLVLNLTPIILLGEP